MPTPVGASLSTGPVPDSVSGLQNTRGRWLRYLPAILIAITLFRFRLDILRAALPLDDFVFYWTAAKLFVSHADPYSLSAMTALQHALGWRGDTVPLLYPPWALPIVGWFGFFQFRAAQAIWRLVLLGMEVACTGALWRYFAGSNRTVSLAYIVLATFIPAAFAEQMGQVTPLMLCGITLFLLLTERNAFGPAGLTFVLLGLKFHLVYLVLSAIVLWAIQERRWTLLVTAFSAIALFTGAAVAFNPHALGYFHAAHPALEILCGVGGALRIIFGPEHRWLQFIPTLGGFIWFAFYWPRHRRNWCWQEQMPVLLLVSLATAPYSWAHDYVLALPAIIRLAVRLRQTCPDWLVPSAMYLGVQMVVFSFLEHAAKPWQALASTLWLGLYLALYSLPRLVTTGPVDSRSLA